MITIERKVHGWLHAVNRWPTDDEKRIVVVKNDTVGFSLRMRDGSKQWFRDVRALADAIREEYGDWDLEGHVSEYTDWLVDTYGF